MKKNVTKKKALIYCRAGSDPSINKPKESLDSQESKGRREAEKDGYEVAEVIRFEGQSGDVENLKIKDRLWQTVLDKNISIIYAASMDRLSRDMTETAYIGAFCHKNNVDLVFVGTK